MALELNYPCSGQRVATTGLISNATYFNRHPSLSVSVTVWTPTPSSIKGLGVSFRSDQVQILSR